MQRLGWETDLEAQGLVIGLGAWGWEGQGTCK